MCTNKEKVSLKKLKIKRIITIGPHIRYIGDLWELEKNLVKITGYKFILEIVDHFSKWMWCYPLINKEGEIVLKKLKNIFIFWKSKNISI